VKDSLHVKNMFSYPSLANPCYINVSGSATGLWLPRASIEQNRCIVQMNFSLFSYLNILIGKFSSP